MKKKSWENNNQITQKEAEDREMEIVFENFRNYGKKKHLVGGARATTTAAVRVQERGRGDKIFFSKQGHFNTLDHNDETAPKRTEHEHDGDGSQPYAAPPFGGVRFHDKDGHSWHERIPDDLEDL